MSEASSCGPKSTLVTANTQTAAGNTRQQGLESDRGRGGKKYLAGEQEIQNLDCDNRVLGLLRKNLSRLRIRN